MFQFFVVFVGATTRNDRMGDIGDEHLKGLKIFFGLNEVAFAVCNVGFELAAFGDQEVAVFFREFVAHEAGDLVLAAALFVEREDERAALVGQRDEAIEIDMDLTLAVIVADAFEVFEDIMKIEHGFLSSLQRKQKGHREKKPTEPRDGAGGGRV